MQKYNEQDYGNVKNFIDGDYVLSEGNSDYTVYNPAFGKVIATVPESTKDEVDKAVTSAHDAQKKWASVPIIERIKHLFQLENLLRERQDEFARIVTIEHGKTYKESLGEVLRAIENVEAACSSAYQSMGTNNKQIATGIDEDMYRVPIGVFSVVAPFNFPLMVPFWFIPYAIGLGNSVILKPSEKVPLTTNFAAKLFSDAGFPPGVFSMINGGKPVVDALLDNKMVKGYSFVGSTPVAEYIYKRATANHKRAQAGASAKNFEVVMPDADLNYTIPSLISSFYGNAGERCLAGSVLVTFPENHDIVLKKFMEQASRMKMGFGLNDDVDMGPLIRSEHKNRVMKYIDYGEEDGAKLLMDGRKNLPKDYKDGYFLGPTVFDDAEADMRIIKDEIFGPVASVMTVKNFDEAIDVINSSRYGNASTIFTTNGKSASKFVQDIDAGNFGINVGVAAPIAFYPFGGFKDSFFGDLHPQGGADHIYFFTERKVVISRW